MTTSRNTRTRFLMLLGQFASLLAVRAMAAQPPADATATFQRYTAALEARLLTQHQSAASFLATAPQAALLSNRSNFFVEQLSPAAQPTGALLHHWRGTAFVAGATAVRFERLLRDFRAYPCVFAPQVVRAQAQPLGSDWLHAMVRVRQKHVMTVVLDADYDVTFGRLNSNNGFSTSRSTRISEIDAPGTDHERTLTPAEEHGFLWRLNTYWTYQQQRDGLWIQIEAVSLSRSIPTGLGWALRPYVRSVPRESLEFTLQSAMDALRR